MLAHGRECSLNGSGRNMLSRILHVGLFRFSGRGMGHGQQSAFTLKYRDSHNGSHSPLTFFRKSRFADVDVPFLIIRPLRLS